MKKYTTNIIEKTPVASSDVATPSSGSTSIFLDSENNNKLSIIDSSRVINTIPYEYKKYESLISSTSTSAYFRLGSVPVNAEKKSITVIVKGTSTGASAQVTQTTLTISIAHKSGFYASNTEPSVTAYTSHSYDSQTTAENGWVLLNARITSDGNYYYLDIVKYKVANVNIVLIPQTYDSDWTWVTGTITATASAGTISKTVTLSQGTTGDNIIATSSTSSSYSTYGILGNTTASGLTDKSGLWAYSGYINMTYSSTYRRGQSNNIELLFQENAQNGSKEASALENFKIILKVVMPAYADSAGFNTTVPNIAVELIGNTVLTGNDVSFFIYSSTTSAKILRLYIKLPYADAHYEVKPLGRYGRIYSVAGSRTTGSVFTLVDNGETIYSLPAPAQGSVVYATKYEDTYSVNGMAGNVVLKSDDIDDTDENHQFVSSSEKSTWNGKQDSLGFTPEDSANKKTTLTDSDVDYPTTNAVNTGLSGKQDSLTAGSGISISERGTQSIISALDSSVMSDFRVIPEQTNSRSWYGMTTGLNGDVYACVLGGRIYKQTGGTGDFLVIPEQTDNRSWRTLTTGLNGDVYACVYDGRIYKSKPISVATVWGSHESGSMALILGKSPCTSASIVTTQSPGGVYRFFPAVGTEGSTTNATVLIRVPDDLTIDTTYITNASFGITASVDWLEEMPWFIYLVNTNNTSSGIRVALARHPSQYYISADSTVHNMSGVGATDTVGSVFGMWLTADMPDKSPTILAGAILMTYDASETSNRWTMVKSDLHTTGMSYTNVLNMCGRHNNVPAGQNGNQSNRYMYISSGIAPTYTTNTVRYTIGLDGWIDFSMHLYNTTGGTPGSGTNFVRVYLPAQARTGGKECGVNLLTVRNGASYTSWVWHASTSSSYAFFRNPTGTELIGNDLNSGTYRRFNLYMRYKPAWGINR